MANQPLNKNYFIASVLIHLIIMFGISYMIKQDAISNKNFVIFGAHSRHTTKALYKSAAVPFIGGSPGTKRKRNSKKSRTKARKNASSRKELSKKKTSTPRNKKTKTSSKAQAIKGLAKKQPLTMPSPTAMLEDSAKQSKNKASKKQKKHLLKKEVAVPQEIEEELTPKHSHPQQATPEKNEPHTPPSEYTNTEQIDAELKTNPAPQDSFDGDSQDEEIIHVGVIDSTDPVTRYHQRVIGQEFSRLWQPPVGVRKGTECTVKIAIDNKGAISTIEFIKRSQVPIYDLSILRLKITKPEFPSSLYGKHMVVVFHQ